MAFDLAFVDSISSSATVRLNLNNSNPWRTMEEGTDFGQPELRRAVVGTLLMEGERVPAAAYGNRVLTLTFDLSKLTPDAAAAQAQLLQRELARRHNFLRYRPDTTQPVYFRTMQSSLTNVIWDATERKVTASVLAEPFAYGEKQTLADVTVTNDPAAVSNGCYLDLTGIIGDVETPAQVKLSGLNSGVFADIILGVRRRGTPSSMATFFQAEAGVASYVDTAVASSTDALMSGSGNNYTRTTFATDTSLNIRLGFLNFPGASGTDLRGRYRLYAMVRSNTGVTPVYTISWAIVPSGGGSAIVSGDTVTYTPLSGNRVPLDLGVLQIPVGADPVVDGYSGVEKSITGGQLLIYAGRPSGSGNLDIDYLALVPDDPERGDDYMTLSLYGLSTAKDQVLDGPLDMVYPQDPSATTIPTWYTTPRVGRIPMLTPSQTNRWIMLRPDHAVPDANYWDVKTRTTTVSVSYWPRYLNVRPVSS